MDNDLTTRRRRAAYRAAHRGTKEMDHLMGRYADAHLENMDEEMLTRFEQLMAIPDPELQAWLLAPAMPEGTTFEHMIADMRRFHGLSTETAPSAEQDG
ncbi:MAG: succinate dehydrogenase assembly factor 2 [Pseudomonadota bacterium]